MQMPRCRDRRDLRIGDVERTQVCDLLADHFAAGRLRESELDERMGLAVAAVTTRDLDALLWDLPALPRGDVAVAPAMAGPVMMAPQPVTVRPAPGAPANDPADTAWAVIAAVSGFIVLWMGLLVLVMNTPAVIPCGIGALMSALVGIGIGRHLKGKRTQPPQQ